MDIGKIHFLKFLPFFLKKFHDCSRKLLAKADIKDSI